MSSPGRPAAHRARTDTRFLIEASPQTQPRTLTFRERDGEQISRSYPGTSSMSTPIMGTPPSPVLLPERPRALSPDVWNLSSPNPSEMPSPLRNALMPMLNLAREAKEEALVDRNSRDNRPAASAPAPAEDHRNSSRPHSSPASPPNPRSPGSQSHRKYRSPRVETDSEGEDNTRPSWRTTTYHDDPSPSHSWRTPTVERVEAEEPRTPPTVPATVVVNRLSPRRSSTKSKVKRSSIAQRRIMEAAALSSDSGIAMSPMCHSPLVSLPLPDIPQSATSVEQLFFPPERPPRSHQREREHSSPIPSPSQSPLALQPVSSSRPESPRSGRDEYCAGSPDRSSGSARGRETPDAMSVPIPLSPGSTLAQTRPPSPAEDARASPKMNAKAGSSKQFARSPSPVEEPAARHSTFYMEDEMIILRVENTLFRVHRYFLERDSTFFKEFFERKLGNGAGRTDATAVRLADVSRREFECLLHFLYNGASGTPNDSILNLVLLLSTASTLAFPAARTHAISALDAASPPLDPVERVFLAEKYAIPAWLRPAYVALCSRSHALEDAEAEVLGLQTTARLARAREAVLEEKVQEWRRAVDRAQSGEGVSKEDMQVREAKLVERVVDDIFAVDA